MTKKETNLKSKYWCFTDFHNEVQYLIASRKFTYLIYGEEICPKNDKFGNEGKKHNQGYVEFPNAITLGEKGFLKITTPRIHYEKRKGTQTQAIDYCKGWTWEGDKKIFKAPFFKENIYFEFGTPSENNQGKRNDLLNLKESLDKGSKLSEIAENHFESFLKYNRGILMYMNIKPKIRNWKTEVYILIGPPGCGKSKLCPLNGYWYAPLNNIWWDGYNGHEDVIIDEFYGGLPFTFMLRLMDRYPLNVEIKNGTVPFLAKRIWITSNKHPSKWYSADKVTDDHWPAFWRRVEQYINLYETPDYFTNKISDVSTNNIEVLYGPSTFSDTEVSTGNTNTVETNNLTFKIFN